MGAQVLMTEDSYMIAFAGMTHTAEEFADIQKRIEDGMLAETEKYIENMISSRDAMGQEFIDTIQREADRLREIRGAAYEDDLQAQKTAMETAMGYEEQRLEAIETANDAFIQGQEDLATATKLANDAAIASLEEKWAADKAWFDWHVQMIEDKASAEADAQKEMLDRIAAEAKAKQEAFDDERRRLDAFKAPSAIFREDFANILAQTLKAQQEGGDVSAGMVEILLREFKKMGVGTSGVIAGDARVNTAEGVVDFRTFFEQVTGQALVGDVFNIESLFHALTDEEKRIIFQNLGLGMYGYAQGGIVPGPIGRPQMAVVHGGEQVIPAGRRGGGITVEFVNKGTIIGVKDWERFLADGIRAATRRGLLA
jgi:chemotaxis protein histidine kinase CheA